MKVTHSVRHDLAYIAFKEIGPGEATFQHSVIDDRLSAQVVLDISADGRLLGVDVMGASTGLPSEILEGAEQIDSEREGI